MGGFIAANSRKSGCLTTGSTSPRSVRHKLPSAPCDENIHKSVRLIKPDITLTLIKPTAEGVSSIGDKINCGSVHLVKTST